MKKLLLGLAVFGLFSNVSAQSEWCVADQEYELMKANNPTYAQEREAFDLRVSKYLENNYSAIEKAAADTMIVPLVIHVIHDNGKGNISKEQILDGVRILNEDYMRMNADTSETREVFKPFASGVNIQFRLAKLDPDGNCTEGIVRVNNPEMSNSPTPRNLVKQVSHWPENKYFNIWIVNSIDAQGQSGIILGYGEFPTPNLSPTYGFVNIHQSWGEIGTSTYGGRTPTHEIGHCLNLYHTFQSGCGSSCNNSGDQVCDTPPTATATYGCNQSQNLCSNDLLGVNSAYTSDVVDQIENYMSYDGCQNMFTKGQRDRMLAAVQNSPALQNLMSPTNLEATGTNTGYVAPDCSPVAAMSASSDLICQGSTVTFTDASYNAEAYDISWSFEGGDITSSSDASVSVTYDNPGTYDVSLTVSNGQGTSTVTYTDYIYVGSTTPDYTDFMREEFASATMPSSWEVNNERGSAFVINETVGFEDNTSLFLANHGQFKGSYDEVILPVFNLNGTTSPTLTFFYAYSARISSNTDEVEFYISTNCGNTWLKRGGINSSNLRTTASPSNTNFSPQSVADWKQASMSLLPYAGREHFLVKIRFIGGGGSNFFMDKFTMGDQVGINELEVRSTISVIPNPVNANAVVAISSYQAEKVQLAVVDIMGREVYAQSIQLMAGENKLPLNVQDQPSGVYFVQIKNEKGLIQQKFVKQ